MLGTTLTWRTTASVYGLGNGPIFVSNLACLGTESKLLECPHVAISLGACSHDRDVGIKCEGICLLL